MAAVAVFGGAWLLQRVELVSGGPLLAVGPLASLPILLLVSLVAVGHLGRRWIHLEQGEVLAVYIMAAVGLPLASTGFVHFLLPGLVTGFYSFADPNGRFYRFFQHIPEWMVPGGVESPAVTGFFEGGVAVPWTAWLAPLAAWSVLAGGFLAALWGLFGLLQRRWMEEERLGFPLAELPLAMLERGAGLERDPLMWAGVAVPAIIYGVNGITHYFLVPGEIPLAFDLGEVLIEEPWRAMAPYTAPFVFELSPLLVGIVYFMSVEVAFSTWFFFLGSRLQLLAAETLGRSADQGTFIGLGGQWREWPNFFPHLQAQARGGLLCIGFLTLWAARGSLAAACRRAVRQRGGEDAASLGALAAGTAVIALWAWAAGLSAAQSTGFVLLLLLTFVGMARLRLDGGFPVVGIYFLVGNLFYFAGGTGPDAFPPSTYVAFAFMSVLSYSGLAGAALIHFEGQKMARALGVSGGGRLGLAVAAGLALGLLAGYWSMLNLVYDHGMFALDQHGGARGVARVGRYVHYLYSEAGLREGAADLDRLGAMGFGALVTAAVAASRTFFGWVPLHPLGFVYGTGFGRLIWGSALAGWGVKVLAVRYGGAGTYRRLRPFFLGMICGDLFMRAVWGLVAGFGTPGGGFRF